MKLFQKREMEQLEQAGAQAGVPLSSMMDQAGQALALEVEKRLGGAADKRVCLLCGSGNNGGDGFVCAGYLAARGAACTILLVAGEPRTALARGAFVQMPDTVQCLCTEHQRAQAEEALSQAQCIVDCVFGFGFRGGLKGDAAHFLSLSNRQGCLRLAADLPSGVECDTGRVSDGAFQAHATVTFTGKKPAHCSYPGKAFCGETVVAQVGIPAALLEEAPAVIQETSGAYVQACLPQPDVQANKGALGRLLLVCGSYGMAGACVMAARGALRAGVGLVHIAIEARAYPIVAQAVPEAVFTVLDFTAPAWKEELQSALEACTACAAGSGLGALADTLCPEVFRYFAGSRKPLLIDADGLNYCARTPDALESLRCPVVATPHPGEMARLLHCTVQEVQAGRLPLARRFAQDTGAVTLLKGAATVIAGGESVAVNPIGNWGMAKGGSGDVLAGIVGSFCAQGMAPYPAAVAGAYLHGLAGDLCRESLGARAMLPTDLPDWLSGAFREIGDMA